MSNPILAEQEHPLGRLFLADKPYIQTLVGTVIQCSLDLRNYYDAKKGFVTRLVRSDTEVKALGLRWANNQ